MVFESAVHFGKVVADYSCEYKTRLNLKPNDKKELELNVRTRNVNGFGLPV